jgi:hypothetical protein
MPQSAKAIAYPVHRIPGRTRFKIHGRHRKHPFYKELSKRLERLPGVSGVETNPLTGSVLVHHTGDVDALIEGALDSDVGEIVEFLLTAPPVAKRLRFEISAIDKRIRSFTDGELDLGTLAALGLIVMAGAQLIRGRSTSSAVSLAWYGTEILSRWREPDMGTAKQH